MENATTYRLTSADGVGATAATRRRFRVRFRAAERAANAERADLQRLRPQIGQLWWQASLRFTRQRSKSERPDTGAALRYLEDIGAAALAPRLVILGTQALHEAEKLVAPMRADQRRPLVVIGLASELGSAVKERALAAGVRPIHDRPAGWADYRDTVKAILQGWLVRV